ncbi:T9SS-dependent M36 family metallopeptidase [Chryseobacterium gotjawalense]|uniref:T9SS-dependent M36 family metallopeptidase n=1 Tax=Chryseobacterium gotjawalense TaxID=3042315 RepID=A0ABY8RHJ3_9FLAO|nr:T9SS-dependent M36 family metallopeptidase [Chryseobacterium sp. wdc7]WHF52552.1 T9SS-dependent M36 family metallopeptidase [Chryseobacterium sp. wdc7]
MKNRNLPLKIAAVCFLFSFGNANSQDFKTIIQSYISAQNNFMKADLKNFEIINEDFSTSMKGDVVKIQQSYNGIPIYNAIGTALIKDKKITYYDDSFAKNYTSIAKPASASSTSSIFANAAQAIGLKNATQYQLIGINDSEKDGVSTVRNRLIYFQTENSDLKLCYEFVFEEKGTSNYWLILADSSSGEILSKSNLTVSCQFTHDAYNHDYTGHLPEGFTKDFGSSENIECALTGPTAFAPLNASYRVYAFPLESPNHGDRTLVINPWFADASPDGWHTVGGNIAPGSFTTTKGNNVFAYEDRNNKNVEGEFADGGTSRVFDFPIMADNATFNLNASITNLFYINNKVHDIFYRLGFTETARNFQAYNFGKGGQQNDYVQAEAQDGGGRNNANFYTPSDGSRPRMQMYLFDGAIVERVFYNTPSEAIGRVVPNVVSTTFGPTLTVTGVTGDVKIASVADGCTALPAGSLTGKIGLIERGTCGFTVKVKIAQDAGATAAIIYNLPDSQPTSGMGGTDSTIKIPSVLIENDEGLYIKNLLATKNVNITLKYDASTQKTRDGSFDNGIVIHEYGHGISNRLTGNGYSCLVAYDSENPSAGSREQMGEGWSDFFALMLTNQPGATKDVARGMGTFASSESISGVGIRPVRYSTDFAVNNYTYRATNSMGTNTSPTVHSIGFVWATMLWDLHWKYVEKYGYSSDVMANKTNGSTRALQLVADGLKLQACNPTFIDGRDAILKAELATTGGEDKCMIWEVFAKRGLGVNASAGSKLIITDQVENFEIPAECKNLATSNVSANKEMSIYPNPAKDEFFIRAAANVLGKVNVQIYDASGKLVSSQKITSSDAVYTQALPNGVYVVKVEGLGVNYSSKLMIKK